MGREIKRVPLSFNWPKDQTWSGYLNPHYKNHCSNCADCKGSGSTTACLRLDDLVGLLMLSSHDALRGRAHPYFSHSEGLHQTFGIAPSKDMAELTSGLAGRNPGGVFGHDAIDRWSARKAIVKAAGLKKSWGTCQKCKGEGSLWDSKESKRRAGNWRSKEPPKGVGYQLWETVSEGSPISPVFKDPEALADWLVSSLDYKWKKNDEGTTREQWLKFICGPGWAPNFISSGTKFASGVVGIE